MYQRSCKIATNSKSHYGMLILVILTLWLQCSWAHGKWMTSSDRRRNPNIPCPEKNQTNIWAPCRHGGYIENHNPEICGDRYICYVGLNERCHQGDKCADNAICTVCDICQKCESRERCSDFRLCPGLIGLPGMNFIKRFIQKRLIETTDDE